MGRAMAVTSPKRSPKRIDAAPAGTPPAIVARINTEPVKLAQDPDDKQQLNKYGQEAMASTPEALKCYVKSEFDTWTQVIKTAALDANPWVAMNVYKAFMQATTQSMARLSGITASHAPLPWLADHTGHLEAVFGADFFPYGIGQDAGGQINRATLQAFCKFGHDQGVCDRLLSVEQLFAKNVLGSFKVWAQAAF
jgi:hypothetical protein